MEFICNLKEGPKKNSQISGAKSQCVTGGSYDHIHVLVSVLVSCDMINTYLSAKNVSAVRKDIHSVQTQSYVGKSLLGIGSGLNRSVIAVEAKPNS